jgi:hypothetical protein
MPSIPHRAFEELSVRMPQCAFEPYCVKFLNTHLRHYRSRCLVVRLRQIRCVIIFSSYGRIREYFPQRRHMKVSAQSEERRVYTSLL